MDNELWVLAYSKSDKKYRVGRVIGVTRTGRLKIQFRNNLGEWRTRSNGDPDCENVPQESVAIQPQRN